MKTEFDKPFAVQFKPNYLATLLVRLMGWRFVCDGLPTKQGVLIGYPHTSNWDFVVMMPIKWAIGLQIQFFAKDSLFRIPLFGRWIRWLGATPIDGLRLMAWWVSRLSCCSNTSRKIVTFGWLCRPRARAS